MFHLISKRTDLWTGLTEWCGKIYHIEKMLTGMMETNCRKDFTLMEKSFDRKDLSKKRALIENPLFCENLSARERI